MSSLDKYIEQYTEFAKIDDFNLEERAKKVPAEKHYWVCQWIDAKKRKMALERKKKKLGEAVKQKMIDNSPVNLNKFAIDAALNDSPSLEKINEELEECSLLIEYLDQMVRQITFIGNDIKNIIAVKTLEEN